MTSTGHLPTTSELTPDRELRCPDCNSSNICIQNKAFVTQKITLADDDVTVISEPWDTEDIEFDGPSWYVCRDCGEHAETIESFKVPSDDELRERARALFGGDECEIDADAKVSRGAETTVGGAGAFVAAWVWVPFKESA